MGVFSREKVSAVTRSGKRIAGLSFLNFGRLFSPAEDSRLVASTGVDLDAGGRRQREDLNIRVADLFERLGPLALPTPLEIEFLETAAKEFASLRDFLALSPAGMVKQNFATSLWEFAHGVDTLTSYPWNISLPVADVCNARCTFCTSWLEGRKVLDIDQLEAFEPVLRRAIYIGLVGHGEPLAHPRFDELCDRLQSMLDPMSSCYTITNGALLDKWRGRLDGVNLRSYSISLNAASAEVHDEIMGLGRDAFPRIVNSIANLTGQATIPGTLGNNVYITMVVTKQNLAEIPAFIALGNRLGVTEIWLRSLLPQVTLSPGLNYHLLPPYEHPDFERLRKSAIDAIASSQVPVQADPAMWDKPLFSTALQQSIIDSPPAVISREEAPRYRNLHVRNQHLYDRPKGAFRGQAAGEGAYAEVKWTKGRLYVVTTKLPRAHAAAVPVIHPESKNSTPLKVTVDADCEAGVLGFGLRDIDKDVFLATATLPAGDSRVISMEAESPGRPVELAIFNGGDDQIVARGSVGEARIEVPGYGQSFPIDWAKLERHNAYDKFDDGTNPLGRVPRFGCKAVYYNLYINEMFYRMNPCCYLQRVPGHEEIRLDGSVPFIDAWNSEAMVALRRHLRDGPLFGACVRCPEKW